MFVDKSDPGLTKAEIEAGVSAYVVDGLRADRVKPILDADTAASVYRPDIDLQAAQMLVDEGLANAADFPFGSDGYKAATPGADAIDGMSFDARTLPKVTPIHGLPKALVTAQDGLIADRFVDFSQLHMVYATPKGPLTVVENLDLKVNRGEFISLIGHSGCGKSTVLTMAAGLNDSSKGAIKLVGTHVEGADPERAVVSQSPYLLPWLSAKQNVAIGVDKVDPKATQTERQEVVDYYLERVGLAGSMDKPASS